MTITLPFEPVMKYTDSVFTGMGRYVVNIDGKLANVDIFSDGEVQFVNWVTKLTQLTDEEKNFFIKYADKLHSKELLDKGLFLSMKKNCLFFIMINKNPSLQSDLAKSGKSSNYLNIQVDHDPLYDYDPNELWYQR